MRPSLLASIVLLAAATVWAEAPKTVTVAATGADFATVQAAVDAAKASKQPTVLSIKPGIYKEKIVVPKGSPAITFKGDTDDPSKVVLTFDLKASSPGPDGKNVGTSGSTSTLIAADDFSAEYVTFENSAGDVGQAVAIKTTGDKLVFRHCRFLGWQDTLYAHGGRVYFADCYIEGRTDFIFGRSPALFERCEIHSKQGSYITAGASPPEQAWGLVFRDCKLTGEGSGKTFLGRPWRDGAMTAFVRCELGDHIKPEGWSGWDGREKTARYYEVDCTGPGADRSKRVDWSHGNEGELAEKLRSENVLAGNDGWNPVLAKH
ncbi:MAG: pectinesterase family protein [Tepidisphaeraceae bacterium]